MKHTAWTAASGYPGNVQALAQTKDGYLWVGTTTGLFRFDGIRFTRFDSINGTHLTGNNISALLATPSGGLWVGFYFGGADYVLGADITRHSPQKALPRGTVMSLALDQKGGVWAATSHGLARFRGASWESIGPDWGLPAGLVGQVFVDRADAVWAVTDTSIFELPEGSSRFEATGINSYGPSVTQSGDGTMWMSDSYKGVQTLQASDHKGAEQDWVIRAEAGGVREDQHGNIWSNTTNGVYRATHLSNDVAIAKRFGSQENFNTQDGLSGNYVFASFEDREGNLWFGTSGGLDRFRDVPFVRVATPPLAHHFSLAAGKQGEIWVGSSGKGLSEVHDQAIADKTLPGQGVIESLYVDPDNMLWVGTGQTLWHRATGNWLEVPLPAGQRSIYTDLVAMTKDGTGNYWASFIFDAVYRLRDGNLERYANRKDLPQQPALALATDSTGTVWFGYSDGRAATFDGKTVQLFSEAQGLKLGQIAVFLAEPGHIWVGGEYGLALYDGTRFWTVNSTDRDELGTVTGIVRSSEGDLWLNSGTGVKRVNAADVEDFIKNPTQALNFDSFDARDGLPGIAAGTRPFSNAVKGTDGRLWFAASDGVAWIDTNKLKPTTLSPPVWIESVSADNVPQRISSAMRLPVQVRRVQITYTALSLSVPERIRFRYRLDGVDRDWADAFSQRSVSYSNLSPGHYRFNVIASNPQGVWNNVGDSLDFSIPPLFYQTRLFKLTCIIVILLIAWTTYALRMRQIVSILSARLEERHRERDRIARALHDTLIQAMQGLIYRFQAATKSLPPDDNARKVLQLAVERANEVIAEGRDQVTDLRKQDTGANLADSLLRFGQELSANHVTPFSPAIIGNSRPIHTVVHEEAYRIAAEALINAFQHARAEKVGLDLSYERSGLCIRVTDNGIGMDSTTLSDRPRDGHFGLLGMRERALRIRARLRIKSQLGAGTEVELYVPSAIAYQSAMNRWWRPWERLIRRRDILP